MFEEATAQSPAPEWTVKIRLLEVEGHVPQCPMAGDANADRTSENPHTGVANPLSDSDECLAEYWLSRGHIKYARSKSIIFYDRFALVSSNDTAVVGFPREINERRMQYMSLVTVL